MSFLSRAAPFAACLTWAALAPMAEARPVSYPGGWTVMQMNNGDSSSLHAHYSPTASDSIGFYAERNWAEDVQFTGLQYNRLLKRWNGPSSQANTYLKLGVGQADPFGDASAELSGFAGFAADWETRRWFASYEAKATDYAGNKSVRHSGRVGVAPYIGDYGDLHTWLMLQVDNHPEGDEPITTTPLVRFFKGVQMVELGYTLETEELLANWIIRF
ncbi:hypothetical protein [Hyphomonas sp.]|uniref:hypothetical protein n=1 Tax=Hyphomonas sp. TaxID=87 RepID=UPI00300255F1